MRETSNPLITGGILLVTAILISMLLVSLKKVDKPSSIDEPSIDDCLAGSVND